MIRRLRILAVFALIGPLLAAFVVAIPIVAITGDIHSMTGRENAMLTVVTFAFYGMMIALPAGLACGLGYLAVSTIFPRLNTAAWPLRALTGALLGMLAGLAALLIYFNGPLYLNGPIRQINLFIYGISFFTTGFAGAIAGICSVIPAFVGRAPT